MELTDLVQKHIIRAMKSDEGNIILVLDAGAIRLRPEGDCCANCYIAHVDGSETLTDAVVTEIENLELPRVPLTAEESTASDAVDSWGHRIHTTKGICTIDMRVEHNGYYGGRLECEEIDTAPEDAISLVDF